MSLLRFIHQSRHRETQIGAENEMILNTLPLINHLQAQIAPLRGEITLIQCLWMRLYMRKMSTICRIKMNSTMETLLFSTYIR